MGFFPLSGDVLTARAPELPEISTLAGDDILFVWDDSENIQGQVKLSDLRTYIETGGDGTLDPVQSGGSIIYEVSEEEAGDDTVAIPSIAGESFKLTQDGYPLKPGDDFLTLAGGGFKLLGGRLLVPGQRYELDIFSLYNGGIPAASADTDDNTYGFIKGSKTVNTNVAVSISDLNKVHKIRGGSSALEITLPDIDSCPDNTFLIFETLTGNTKQHRILTTGSQSIFLDNEDLTDLYIGVGEKIWFYRDDDGWLVVVEKGNFSNLAQPFAAYKAGLNQIRLAAQVLNRADYPRLWRYVQTLGAGLVSEATWTTNEITVAGRPVYFPYRGCFSTGDGSTNFRLPDFQGSFIRGLKNDGGSDTERAFNTVGNFQRNEFESHTHEGWMGDGATGASVPDNDDLASPNAQERKYTTLATGGYETRPDNIGLHWFINY